MNRRHVLTGAGGLLLAGCDKVVQIPGARKILFAGEDMHRGLQRVLVRQPRLFQPASQEVMPSSR